MIGALSTRHDQLNTIDVVVRAVDQRGREMDERWGIGRLPTLVPIDVAERFRSQQRKFSAAMLDLEPDAVIRHGEAMLRAYAKLDELAVTARGGPAPVDQWEFETPLGLVVLVRDIRDASEARLAGRAGQVWSLDEIASVIRAHPTIVAAKNHFAGAVVESVRPSRAARQELNDALSDVPF